MSYQILDHRADVRVSVSAPSLEELFCDGVRALMEVSGPIVNPYVKKVSCDLEISGKDLTGVFINTLNEVLFRMESQYVSIEVAGCAIRGKTSVYLTFVSQKAESFSRVVKAVTYHEANLVRGDDGVWRVTIVLDV